MRAGSTSSAGCTLTTSQENAHKQNSRRSRKLSSTPQRAYFVSNVIRSSAIGRWLPSSYSREDVVVEFTQLHELGLRTPVPKWMERNKDKYEWVKEETERVKAGTLATRAGDIPAV